MSLFYMPSRSDQQEYLNLSHVFFLTQKNLKHKFCCPFLLDDFLVPNLEGCLEFEKYKVSMVQYRCVGVIIYRLIPNE